MAKHARWENFTLDEMILHLTVCLDWTDAYKKYGEGSCIALFHDCEFEFNSEYETFNVKRILADGAKQMIYSFDVPMFRLIESIIDASIGGVKFGFWDKETLVDSAIYELDQLQTVLLLITKEGKYITPKEMQNG